MKQLWIILTFLSWSNLSFGQIIPSPRIEKVEHPTSLAEQTISAENLKEHLSILASDDFEGRETATEGQKKAAQYLVQQIKSFGIEPLQRKGIEEGYLQRIPFLKESWGEVKMNVNGKDFRHLRDFYAFRRSNEELPLFKTDEIIFLGYGIDDKMYSDYEGVNVAGKIIVILNEEPKNKDGISWITGNSNLSNWSSNWRNKLKVATEKGVKAVLMIDPNIAQNIEQYRRFLVEPSIQMVMGDEEKESSSFTNLIYISPELAKEIIGDGGKKIAKVRKQITKKGKAKSFFTAVNLEIQLSKSKEYIYSENVLAFIEGTDPQLKDEIVVVTAHYDHLGKRGDEIYNGADDNGSGSSTLLTIAQTFALAKQQNYQLRRSVLIMWVSGEEKGLLGSEYYVSNPIFPLKNTIVNINVDMVGRIDKKYTESNNPNYIYVIGADRLSSELHTINDEMNRTYTNLILDYTYNDENDPNRYYYRSDHYNFAEKNIPAIFFFNGTHADYHKTSDTVEKINFDKMSIIGRLVFHDAWELSNRDKRIEVDVVTEKKE